MGLGFFYPQSSAGAGTRTSNRRLARRVSDLGERESNFTDYWEEWEGAGLEKKSIGAAVKGSEWLVTGRER